MVSIEEAQSIILQATERLPLVEVPLLHGLGCVIGTAVRAPFDIPLVDNSAMDGYAFSSEALQGDRLKVAGVVTAGHSLTTPVPPGSAVRIMTGSPLPRGCDTVIPIEDVREEGDGIRLAGPARAGVNIRHRGEDVWSGEEVVPEGALIRPQEIAMLASLGMRTLPVYKKATASILATGDELLPLGEKPVPGRTANSNSAALAAQVLEAGGEPIMLGIAPDDLESTKRCILDGMKGVDLLITTGGVSVGDKDYVKEAIEKLGGKILFWKVNMKPGKPVAFAILEGKPVFALPGNPVAVMVAFEQFVRPALLKMMGRRRIFRPVIKAKATTVFRNSGARPHLVRAVVTIDRSGVHVVSGIGNQSPGNILSLVESNALLRIAPETVVAAGEAAEVMLLDRGFEMGRHTAPAAAD